LDVHCFTAVAAATIFAYPTLDCGRSLDAVFLPQAGFTRPGFVFSDYLMFEAFCVSFLYFFGIYSAEIKRDKIAKNKNSSKVKR
jgi:hypothetical protein